MITPIVQGGIPKLLSWSKASYSALLVPTNRIYYLSWLGMKYIADATVASRSIIAQILAVNTDVYYLVSSSATASQTKRLTYNLNVSTYTSPSDACAGVGMVIPLYPGQSLEVAIVNGQAGDSWTLEGVYFEVPITCP